MLVSSPVNLHSAHYPFMSHSRMDLMGRAYQFIWQPRFGWRRRLITEPLMRIFLKKHRENIGNVFHLRFRHHMRDVDVDIESKDLQLAPFPKGFECGSEPDLQILLLALTRDIGAFYDIGANFGFFSLFLACQKNFQGKIYAFEPSPVTYAHLKKLAAAVDLDKHIETFAVALSDQDGTVFMNSPVETHSGYTRIGGAGANTSAVPSLQLDHWFNQGDRQGPGFIKLDVEGHEANVLRGGAQTIDWHRPFVFYESSWDIKNAEQDEIFDFFKNRNYAVYLPTWIYEENDWWRTCRVPLPRPDNHLALIDLSAYKETLHDRRLLRSLNLFACPTEKISLLNERLQALHIG